MTGRVVYNENTIYEGRARRMNRRVDGSVADLLNALARLSRDDQMHGFELTYATTGGHGGHDLDVLRQVSKTVRAAVGNVRREMQITLKRGWLFSQSTDWQVSDRTAEEMLTAKIEVVFKGLESYSAWRNITGLKLHHLPIKDKVSVTRFACE